ncbi:Uncharacterised protein [uncultured archaeon]|nr:Uncharacterised protein [uncultured archaeon]
MAFEELGKMIGSFFSPEETFEKEKEYSSFGSAFINSSLFTVLLLFLTGLILLSFESNLPGFFASKLNLSFPNTFFLFQLNAKYLFLGCLFAILGFFIVNSYFSFFGQIGGKLFGQTGEFTMQFYSNSLWLGLESLLLFFGILLTLFFTPLAVWLGSWVYYMPLTVMAILFLYSFRVLAESYKVNQKMNLFQGFLTFLLALVIPVALIVFLG